MEFNLKEGITNTVEITVREKDTAAQYGSGLVPVFATPAMVALMENTAHTSIGNLLPDGYNSVGTEINVKHIKATPVGMKVTCESVLTKAEGKRLHFEIRAWDEEGEIGKATHERYIIDAAKFMEKLKSKI